MFHATRVMVIGATLPFVLKWLWEADLSIPSSAPLASIAWPQLALTVFCDLAGRQIARRIGIFGAAIPGPVMETILARTPWLQAELTVLAQIFGADMVFAVAHSVSRILIAILAALSFAQLFKSPNET